MGHEQLVITLDRPAGMTAVEQYEFSTLELTIERGLTTFVEVGNALMVIRDRGYYRQEYGTFENYCRQRWGMSRVHAHRLIESAEVVGNLLPLGNIPTNERQARPLTSLEPEEQRTVWKTAVETSSNGKPTAAHVERVKGEFVAPPPPSIVHFSSQSDEHNTPQEIIGAVLDCMDDIDLDPCSNSHDAPNVPARILFTKDEDGLTQEWRGRVYMNPPYGREIGRWIDKLCQEHKAGKVSQAIALIPARTDTQWWDGLRDFPICFIKGRLVFGGNENSAPFPSAVVYLGENIDRFYYAFCNLGDIWQRIEPGMFGE